MDIFATTWWLMWTLICNLFKTLFFLLTRCRTRCHRFTVHELRPLKSPLLQIWRAGFAVFRKTKVSVSVMLQARWLFTLFPRLLTVFLKINFRLGALLEIFVSSLFNFPAGKLSHNIHPLPFSFSFSLISRLISFIFPLISLSVSLIFLPFPFILLFNFL